MLREKYLHVSKGGDTMRIRLYHAKILTMQPNTDWFEGEVWIHDNRIEKVIQYNTENYIGNLTIDGKILKTDESC